MSHVRLGVPLHALPRCLHRQLHQTLQVQDHNITQAARPRTFMEAGWWCQHSGTSGLRCVLSFAPVFCWVVCQEAGICLECLEATVQPAWPSLHNACRSRRLSCLANTGLADKHTGHGVSTTQLITCFQRALTCAIHLGDTSCLLAQTLLRILPAATACGHCPAAMQRSNSRYKHCIACSAQSTADCQ